MRKETMTPRERWLAVLQRKTPDRVPMDYWATPEATARLCRLPGCDEEEMRRRLHLDLPLTVAGRYVGPPPKEGEDIWGCRHTEIRYEGGVYREVVNHPLAGFHSVGEIEAHYRWPDPDWWDYSGLPAQVKGHEHRPIRGGGSEPFLLYKYLRGDEQAFMDLVENPEIVESCLARMFELACQDTLRIFETIPGRVMITCVAEDLGGQSALMLSREHIRHYLLRA